MFCEYKNTIKAVVPLSCYGSCIFDYVIVPVSNPDWQKFVECISADRNGCYGRLQLKLTLLGHRT